jgi:uncharacterized protein YdeI (YjbR/CyaY-like superfamily)
MPSDELPDDAIQPTSRAAWRAWLARHHARDRGVWLVSWKKATGKQAFDYGAAVEEALCFGWIDSLPRKLDAERGMLWFAPRQAKSKWSQANKARVARLQAEGRIAPPGAAKIAAAQRDGTWTALDAVSALVVPSDLAAALAQFGEARARFDAFPPSARRGILEWIDGAKKAATRARRVAETAVLAQRGERANQWSGQRKGARRSDPDAAPRPGGP